MHPSMTESLDGICTELTSVMETVASATSASGMFPSLSSLSKFLSFFLFFRDEDDVEEPGSLCAGRRFLKTPSTRVSA